jgi:sensor domain CHASE-containing protein
MTLGLKTIVLLAAVITLSILAQFAIMARSVLPGLESAERQVAEKNLRQALGLLAEEERDLSGWLADWAGTSDTVAFLRDSRGDYPLAELVYESLLEGNFDLFALYDNQGGLLWGAIPEGIGADGPARAEAMDALLREGMDPRFLKANQPVSGLMELSGKGLILAARPVVDRELGSSATGRLIMARLLSDGLLAGLVKSLGAPLTISVVGEERQGAVAAAFAGLPGEAPFLVLPQQGPFEAVQAVMRDLSGEPILLVEAPAPRELFAAGRKGIHNALTTVLLVASALFFILLFGLQFLVLRPISKLAREVASLSLKDSGARLKGRRKGEIGIISQEFNALLERLESDGPQRASGLPDSGGPVAFGSPPAFGNPQDPGESPDPGRQPDDVDESETLRRVRRLLED